MHGRRALAKGRPEGEEKRVEFEGRCASARGARGFAIQLRNTVKATITALSEAARTGEARTGEVGAGKLFVLRLERVVRIRTGEENQAAVRSATPVE